MERLFPELRRIVAAEGIDQAYWAKYLGITERCLNNRLNNIAKASWRLSEIYQTMDMLKRPYAQIPLLFPNYQATPKGFSRRKKG